MASKTIKTALADALANLSEKDLKRFVHKLLDRRDKPRVTRNRVDGKDYLDIADVLVSTFTEKIALQVALDILRDIDCRDVVEDLIEDTGGLSSEPSAGESVSVSLTEGDRRTESGDFVDKHRAALIQNISNIDPILDRLLGSVIQQEAYDQIRVQSTKQDQVRELYKFLQTERAKREFYELLQDHEAYLTEELRKKK